MLYDRVYFRSRHARRLCAWAPQPRSFTAFDAAARGPGAATATAATADAALRCTAGSINRGRSAEGRRDRTRQPTDLVQSADPEAAVRPSPRAVSFVPKIATIFLWWQETPKRAGSGAVESFLQPSPLALHT